MATIKVAVGQMCSSSCLKTNARIASKLVDMAVKANAKVLFLPEAADYISRNTDHSIRLAELTKRDFLEPLQEKIRSYHKSGEVDDGIFVAVGIHAPASCENRGRKVQNNQLWISNKGEILHRYQKVHLFDVNIANGPVLKESDAVEPGTKIHLPFKIGKRSPCSDFRVGLAICYDIRFPEMASRLRQKGAHIITYPSAFTTKTGEAHWRALGRARAIDTQCYIVMAAQCGSHDVTADLTEEEKAELNYSTTRDSYGQALIVDPWGEIIAEAPNYQNRGAKDEDGDYYEMITADLSKEFLYSIRRELPVLRHRRPVIYLDSYPER